MFLTNLANTLLAALLSGQAFHYQPPKLHETWCRSLECVYSKRLAWGQIARRPLAANALVSVQRCSHLGQLVYGTVAGRRLVGYVVDCSQPRDVLGQTRRGLILETNWAYAVAGGWATYGGQDGPGHAPARITQFVGVPWRQ